MGPVYRLAIHPATGDLWQYEQGPNGGDEMNVIRPGANYGWPLVSYGTCNLWGAVGRCAA